MLAHLVGIPVEETALTLAPLAVPLSSTSASGVLRDAPVALFQFALGTIPASSVAAVAVPLPTKSMLTTPGVAALVFPVIAMNKPAIIRIKAANISAALWRCVFIQASPIPRLQCRRSVDF